ncbi:synaptonemal complex protein ZEP1 [Cryptomeria japonica]|uniref:synaptonemal complex protein ZEP1 n=1 Tax=Cryptomeria japonica TaxID=3369 RepID=UPI0027DA2A54|nr:synaptonemal complex protein ZEP1 [Cryptomeria japonica]
MATFQLSLQKSSGSGFNCSDAVRRPLLGLARKSPQTRTDFRATENFTVRKQSAEKLVQDQASANNDLQNLNSKLKKSSEQILRLELKLQHISNENDKLKVKQKEDAKIWRGLDSKLSSMKMIYEQFTETLQNLAMNVEEAEGSKQILEDKLTERLKSFEELSVHLNALSSRLNTAEEITKKRELELQELLVEKEQISESYDAEVIKANLLIAEKDHIEKQLQSTIEEDNRVVENVQAHLRELERKLSLKENACASLHVTQSKLVTEKAQLKTQIQEYGEKLLKSENQREVLRDEILRLSDKVIELETISVVASNNVDRLLQEIDKSTELAQKEKRLAREKAQIEFDHLNGQFQDELSAKESLQAQLQESNNQVIELQKTLDLRTEEHTKKEQEAHGKLDDARQELDKVIKNKCQLETTIGNWQENIASLSRSLSEAQKHKEDLMITISKLQTENKDAHESFQLTLRHKEEENEKLLKKIAEDNLTIKVQETEISQLQQESFNKALMIVQIQERIKELEEQNGKKEEENGKLLKNIAEDNLTIKVQETEISQLQQESLNKAQMIMQVQERIKELEEQNVKKEEENGKLLKKIAEDSLSIKVQVTEISQLQQESLNKAQMIVQVQERIKELEEQNGKKGEENGNLLKKIAEDKLAIKLQETQMNQLQQELLNKAQMMLQVQGRQKELEKHNGKISAQLLAAGHSAIEIRRQCELQIEAKQAELTRHLKEISQHNDQEINDIRRRCETEMRESIIKEKEKEKLKADAMLEEAKKNTEQRVAKIQDDASRCLQKVEGEHESLVKRLMEERDNEKKLLHEQYAKEMNKKKQQFEKDLEEQQKMLTKDAEIKVKDLQIMHQEEVKKLHEEQNLQLKKEEEKRASIELQIKIMKEKILQETQRKEDDLRMNLNKGPDPAAVQLSSLLRFILDFVDNQ